MIFVFIIFSKYSHKAAQRNPINRVDGLVWPVRRVIAPDPFPFASDFLDACYARRKAKTEFLYLHTALFGYDEMAKLMNKNEDGDNDDENDDSQKHKLNGHDFFFFVFNVTFNIFVVLINDFLQFLLANP